MTAIFGTAMMETNYFVIGPRNHGGTRRSTLGVTKVEEIANRRSASTATPILVVNLAKAPVVVNGQFLVTSTRMLRNVDLLVDLNRSLVVDF